jgi:hypothetical protein
MSRALFLLLPALVLQAQDSVIPGAVEVRPGVFVLRGAPNEGTCTAIKKQHITHVLDLRRDGEVNLNCESEASHLQGMEIQYIRYAITKAPPAGDFDFVRSFLNSLPRGAKVLIHCDNGNRAAAVLCPWLVLDKGLPAEEALKIVKSAGMRLPETEEAVRKYLASKGRG